MRTEGGKRPNWVDKTGLLIALASVIVAIVAISNRSNSSVGDSSVGKSPAKLALVDWVVKDAGLGPERSRLEITLHNIGGRLAVIDAAEINVKRVYALSRCASQGDIPLSQAYGVRLPVNTQPGTVIKSVLHQQIGADEADRFAVELSPKWPHNRSTGTIYLFEIRVVLQTDTPQRTLPLGTALVSLPVYPYSGEYYWTAETPTLIRGLIATSPTYVNELKRFSMSCWQGNTAILRKAFASEANQSAKLKAISREFISPSFAALE